MRRFTACSGLPDLLSMRRLSRLPVPNSSTCSAALESARVYSHTGVRCCHGAVRRSAGASATARPHAGQPDVWQPGRRTRGRGGARRYSVQLHRRRLLRRPGQGAARRRAALPLERLRRRVPRVRASPTTAWSDDLLRQGAAPLK
eukprot:2146756-Pleurochrysis_carterae.AAC.3